MTKGVNSSSEMRWVPEGDGPPRLILCEQGGRWAAALRQRLDASGPPVYETRSLADCWETLARFPASFVVVEVTRANVEAVLERMVQSERQYPLARVAAVADHDLAAWEGVLREAGAVHFVVSPRHAGPLAQIARRHLERMPKPRQTLTERIWADLPWGGMREEG